MVPWVLLDTATVPGSGGELRLLKRGDELVIMLGRAELMNSRRSTSEEALATLATARLGGRARPRVLIGGLGMGFTLRAALATLPADAAVEVVELVPAVVAWARGPMAALFGGCLDDPRVVVREGDVAEAIGAARAAWDAILIDVDNGPEGLTSTDNDALYDHRGLAAAHAALRPRGVLAVWSAVGEARFPPRLRAAGFDVDEVRVPAHGARGTRHTIWIASRRAAGEGGAGAAAGALGAAPRPARRRGRGRR